MVLDADVHTLTLVWNTHHSQRMPPTDACPFTARPTSEDATGPYYLLLTTCYLLLATHYLLLATHYLLHTTYYVLLTTHYSLLTIYYVLFIIR